MIKNRRTQNVPNFIALLDLQSFTMLWQSKLLGLCNIATYIRFIGLFMPSSFRRSPCCPLLPEEQSLNAFFVLIIF